MYRLMTIHLHFYGKGMPVGIEFGQDSPDFPNISLQTVENLGRQILSENKAAGDGDLTIDLINQQAIWKPRSGEDLTLSYSDFERMSNIFLGAEPKTAEPQKLPAPKGISALKGKKGKWFANLLRRTYANHFVIKTAMKKMLGKTLSETQAGDLRRSYVDFLDSADDWIDSLKERYSDLEDLFGEDELEMIYEERLLKSINRRLKSGGMERLTPSELKKYRAERQLRKFERLGSPPGNFLDSLACLDIPLDKLALIETTESRKAALNKTWRRVLEELADKGRLKEPPAKMTRKERIVHLEYGVAFIRARELIPDEMLSDEYLRDLTEFPIEDLQNFIIHEEAYLESNISLESPELRKKREVYQETINPALERILSGYRESPDADYIAGALYCFNDLATFKRDIERICNRLSEEEKSRFSKSHVADLLYRKLEKCAIDEFDLTPKQIENFRQHQTAPARIKRAQEQLKGALEEFRAMKETGQDENEAAQELLLSRFPRIAAALGGLNDFPDIFSLSDIAEEDRAFLEAAFSAFLASYLGSVPLALINQSEDEKKLLPHLIPLVKAKSVCLRIFGEDDPSEKINHQFERYEADIRNEKAQELMRMSPPGLNKLWNEITTWDDRCYRGEDVIEDFMNRDFTHPSRLSKEAAAKLMDISKLVSKITLEKRNLTGQEKTRCANLLMELCEIPGLAKNVNAFLKKTEFEHFLDEIPSVFRPFVKPAIAYQEKLPVGITKKSVELASDFLKIKKNYEKNTIILDKAERLLEIYRDPDQTIRDQDRLTYQELGQMYRAQKISPDLLKSFEIEEPVIQDFIAQTEKAQRLYREISELVLGEAKTTFHDGDIQGYVGKKKKAWIGHRLKFFEMSVILIADHNVTHGVKLYHHSDGTLKCSHVEDKYEDTALDLYHMAISETWRLNIAPLLSSNMAAIVKDIYGEEYDQEIQKMFEKAENQIHNHDFKIENSMYRVLKAGLASFAPIINLFGPVTGQKVEKHRGQEEHDFTEVYQAFISGEGVGKEQICSEFVSASTLAALISVNKQLAAKLKEEHPRLDNRSVLRDLKRKGYSLDPDVKDYLEGNRYFGEERSKTKKAERQLKKILKEAAYSADDIDLIIRINNEEIFNIPYDKRERLEAIHPGRMISLLEKKKCVERIDPPQAFTELVKAVSSDR